jgi:hypothetical protein
MKKICPNNGKNIIMTQFIDIDNDRKNYKIILTARQGLKFWYGLVDKGIGTSNSKGDARIVIQDEDPYDVAILEERRALSFGFINMMIGGK